MIKSRPVIIVILIVAIAATITLIVYNAFGFKRTFTILTFDKEKICFMVNHELTYEVTELGFKYYGGKNSGEFTLERSKFDPSATKVQIGEFESTYKKEKNLRIYQYRLGEDLILTDRFVYASKSPLNLVPYRESCETILKNHKKHQAIFQNF